jgi:predicted AAA+ superfamily ATPase
LKTNAKYFIVDIGLRRHTLGKKDGNFGNRQENIVFLELLRRGYTVDVGRIGTKEIDFIARKVDEKLYVQVTYEMPESTREVDNLLLVNDNYRQIIVTGRYFEEKMLHGIPIIYIVDWLLREGV